MQINQRVKQIKTHEGAVAKHINKEQMLKRSVLSCLLWEKSFYESGVSIASRIMTLADQCDPSFVAQLAVDARFKFKLRHAPLLLLLSLIKKGGKLAENTIYSVINRPDEIGELVSLYWMDGKRPLSAAMKRGLGRAFNKFDEYQFAKWNRDREFKIRDAMFLVHPKPENDAQAEVFKKIANNTLSTPNTWESRMAGGEDKKTVFTDLLKRKKLGYMALLRNLRGMLDAGVSESLIREAISNVSGVVLPYRFISAAKHAPRLENSLDNAMMKLMDNHEKLPGKTVILVDVSGSMIDKLSSKSDLNRVDAACGLAILLSGICKDIRVITFSESVVEVPPRKGMALRDAILGSQPMYGTKLGAAVDLINHNVEHDRLVIITDEQSSDRVPDPLQDKSYIINVASYKNGIGYGKWTHIDGFSEACIDFIIESEKFNRSFD